MAKRRKNKVFIVLSILLCIVVVILLLRRCSGGADVEEYPEVKPEMTQDSVKYEAPVEEVYVESEEEVGKEIGLDRKEIVKPQEQLPDIKSEEAEESVCVPVEEKICVNEEVASAKEVEAIEESEAEDVLAPEVVDIQAQEAVEIKPERKSMDFTFALKTNLLYDVLLAPNIEIEFPFAKDRVSIMAEYWAPWWVAKNNSWCYQVMYGGVEARVWFGEREKLPTLSGHFVGVYGGAGMFDLEWDNIGYQSKFYFSTGVTYGYSFPVRKNLRIETSVSVGYMRANYANYEAMEDGRFLVWDHDGIFQWFGPTKLKVSFVWVISTKDKGGRR